MQAGIKWPILSAARLERISKECCTHKIREVRFLTSFLAYCWFWTQQLVPFIVTLIGELSTVTSETNGFWSTGFKTDQANDQWSFLYPSSRVNKNFLRVFAKKIFRKKNCVFKSVGEEVDHQYIGSRGGRGVVFFFLVITEWEGWNWSEYVSRNVV